MIDIKLLTRIKKKKKYENDSRGWENTGVMILEYSNNNFWSYLKLDYDMWQFLDFYKNLIHDTKNKQKYNL